MATFPCHGVVQLVMIRFLLGLDAKMTYNVQLLWKLLIVHILNWWYFSASGAAKLAVKVHSTENCLSYPPHWNDIAHLQGGHEKISFENCMSHALQWSLRWRHNECDGVSNLQPHDRLLNWLFKANIKDNIKAPRYWPWWGEFTSDR